MKRKIFEIFVERAETSSCHGIPNFVREKNWFIKILWAICIISSLSYCLSNLTLLFISYYNYDVQIQFTTNRLTSIEFPTVTFCNKNPFNFQKSTLDMNSIEELEGLKSFFLSNKLLEIINSLDAMFYIQFGTTKMLVNKTIVDTMGFNIEEMLINCRFNTLSCSKNDFEEIYLPSFGKCYKFNSGRSLNGSKVEIKRVSVPGLFFGFRLELFIGSSDHELDLISSSGLRLFIHNSSTVPYANFDAIDLPVGHQTNIAVSQEHTIKLPKPYSECIKDTKDSNSFTSSLFNTTKSVFGNYLQKNCLMICFNEFFEAKCGCKYPEINQLVYSNICQFENLGCISNSYKNLSQSARCFEECPQECESIRYGYSISQSDFPSLFYAEILKAYNNKSDDFNRNLSSFSRIKSSVLAVEVYYDDIAMTLIKERPAKTPEQLVSEMGGILGICLGISFLTIAEFFDLIVQIIKFLMKKKTNKSQIVQEKLKTLKY
ncbi:acid-sensing ion channel 1 isoform X2 [Brachionus plicatilis]|uniref:Acid-sensing ion channel 1 isoform X2 n=1 Tax=Brachionus plicatilis TaxID=10195 RepID=A0A3M7SP79_BRAPC|nr:acid-sensing ion channel 1 isoform X2 [Brachionus plicatilis]